MIKLYGPDGRVLDLRVCPNRATEHAGPRLPRKSPNSRQSQQLNCIHNVCTRACYGVGLDRMQTTDARLLDRPPSSATRALIITRRPCASCPGASRFTTRRRSCLRRQDSQEYFRVRLCTLSAIAARCCPDARLAALGGHEISLVIVIGVYPQRSQAIDQSQRR